MKTTRTHIPDIVVFEPDVHGDHRGFFMETYRREWFDELEELEKSPEFVQDNHSQSTLGVLRGLHLQTENTQGKLIRVIQGEIFDVAVDMRLNSPTYGQWVGEYLSADNKKSLWVPEGFAHGFAVTSEHAQTLYKCTNLYDPATEKSIAWNDETLAIEWPEHIMGHLQLSQKDNRALAFYHGLGFKAGTWTE